jgi:hypothetical protein
MCWHFQYKSVTGHGVDVVARPSHNDVRSHLDNVSRLDGKKVT